MLLANLNFLLLRTNGSRFGGMHEIEQLVIKCQRKEDYRELLCNLTFYVPASIINNLGQSEPSNSACHETRLLTQGNIEFIRITTDVLTQSVQIRNWTEKTKWNRSSYDMILVQKSHHKLTKERQIG